VKGDTRDRICTYQGHEGTTGVVVAELALRVHEEEVSFHLSRGAHLGYLLKLS